MGEMIWSAVKEAFFGPDFLLRIRYFFFDLKALVSFGNCVLWRAGVLAGFISLG